MAPAVQLPHPLRCSLPLLMGGSPYKCAAQAVCLCDSQPPLVPAAVSEAIAFVAPEGSVGGEEVSGTSSCGQRAPGMKLGAACLLCLLLACLTLPIAHCRIRQRSMEIRSKDSRSKALTPTPPHPCQPPASSLLYILRFDCICGPRVGENHYSEV